MFKAPDKDIQGMCVCIQSLKHEIKAAFMPDSREPGWGWQPRTESMLRRAEQLRWLILDIMNPSRQRTQMKQYILVIFRN